MSEVGRSCSTQVRELDLDLFEYQGKQLFTRAGIAVPEGGVADCPDEAEKIAAELGGPVAVKAQVQVGGRGKAGGIKIASDAAEARSHAEKILGMEIRGHTVRQVWIERATANIAREYYVSFMLDRANGGYLGMCSAQGGVDIEAVAESDPTAIAKVYIDPLLGLKPYHVRQLVFGASLDRESTEGVSKLLGSLFEAFCDSDAELFEVNPLVITDDGEVIALDAKVSLDDNAIFRHPEFEELRDTFAVDPQERMAKERNLNYIKLGGDVGVIGNGAGLVMSTLDVIAQAGGKAANFLDIGGGAQADVVAAGLDVIMSDENVKSVLINIFGGITRGDEVARGIIEAFSRIEVRVPVVVRLDGTNAAEGRDVLAKFGDADGKLIAAETMLEAAARAVSLAKSE